MTSDGSGISSKRLDRISVTTTLHGSVMPLPPIPAPLAPPLTDDRFLVGLVAEITRQPPEEVGRRLALECRRIGSNVEHETRRCGIERHVWSQRLIEFYAQTDAFLYELLAWNRTWYKNAMRSWIGGFLHRDFQRPARILAYGDGLGFDSVYLARAGHDVSYFEVSEYARRFARSIFDSAGVSVRLVNGMEEVEPESFDVVSCLDVLEHVPDPPALVRQMAAVLKPGGRMIVHAPFGYLGPTVATHLLANRAYSGDVSRLYAPSGLRLIDGRTFWDPVVLKKDGGSAAAHGMPAWRAALLRGSGCLLAIGRHWSLPQRWIASLLLRRRYRGPGTC